MKKHYRELEPILLIGGVCLLGLLAVAIGTYF